MASSSSAGGGASNTKPITHSGPTSNIPSERDIVALADSIARKGDLHGAIKAISELLGRKVPPPLLVQAEAFRVKAAAELGLNLFESAVVSCNMSLARCPAEPATLRLKARALVGLKAF